MFVTAFGITLFLFILMSVLCVLSLHSDNEKYFNILKYLLFLSFISFIVTGFIRFNPTSVNCFVKATHTIWGYFYMFSFLMLLILVYLFFSRWRNQIKSIMAIAVPFITVFLIVSVLFIDSSRRFSMNLEHTLLPVHIFITIVGELFFFFSFIGSILYLITEWQLRKKVSMKFVYRLPNLETIEKFIQWAISRSLILLTIGLLMGIFMVWATFNSLFLATPKEIIIYSSWVVILGICYLRFVSKINSHRINQINAVLFIIIMGFYVFVNIYIKSGFHSYR